MAQQKDKTGKDTKNLPTKPASTLPEKEKTEKEREGVPLRVVGVQQQSMMWNAPLPPPADMQGYGRVSKDFPERIFKTMEQEATHRRRMDWGNLMFASFIIIMLTCAVGYAVYEDKLFFATPVGLVIVVGLLASKYFKGK